jgi:two-component system nitrate/nitrite response regulator NarL
MILIASAVPRVCSKWTQVLKENFSVFEVSDKVALKRNMMRRRPSILFLDLDLPQLGGVEGVSGLRRLSPSTNIILLANSPNDREAIGALKTGVKGYCNMDINPILLMKAVEVVQKGEIWVGRKVIPGLLEELTSITERRQKDSPLQLNVHFDSLTPRERQIANLVGDGANNKEIGNRLKITERTVKAHLSAAFRKLKIQHRLRLALLVAEHNRVTR